MIDPTEHYFKAGQTLPEKAVKEAIRKAAEGRAKLDSTISRGPRLDFSKTKAPTAPLPRANIGELSALQRKEVITRSERDRQFDALPVTIQRAAQDRGVTDILALQSVALIKSMGGNVRISRSDAANRLGITPEKADEALTVAVKAGLLAEYPSYSPVTRSFASRL